MRKNKLLVILLLLCSLITQAQNNYPVQCTPIIQAPYSLSWPEYASSPTRLQIQLLLKDFSKTSLEVSLRIRLQRVGLVIQNNPDFISQNTFTLTPGVPLMASGSDIPDNFALQNLETQGMEATDLYSGSDLPPGLYQWSVEVVELIRNRVTSNTGVAYMTVFKNLPPLITFPQPNAVIDYNGQQNFFINWTPRHTSSFNAAQGTNYIIRIYEIPDEAGDPQDINALVASGVQPISVTESDVPYYNYGPTDVLLTPGKRYAIQIQATDANGFDSFENEGRSQVVAFQYGNMGCASPTNLTASNPDAYSLLLSWQGEAATQGYIVEYKTESEFQWNIAETTAPELLLIQLPPATTYQYRVRGRCEYGQKSSYSSTELASTPAEEEIMPEEVLTIDYPEPNLEQVSETEFGANDNNTDEDIAAQIDQILNTPIKTFIANNSTGILPDSIPTSLPVLNSKTATIAELQAALKSKKATCAGINSPFTCGASEPMPSYSGAMMSIAVGDELAMNTMLLTVVDIDGNGNGTGLIKVPMMNNINVSVILTGIKAAEGGCITAGSADLGGVALSDSLRARLDRMYTLFNKALDVAEEHADVVAKVYNSVADQLAAIREKANILISKIDNKIKPDSKEIKELQSLAETAIAAKQKELELLRKTGQNPEYTDSLANWLNEQNEGLACLKTIEAAPTTPTPPTEIKKGPAQYDEEFFLEPCKLAGFTIKEPVKPMSNLVKAWNMFISNFHVIRANDFAVANKIDDKDIFETSIDDKSKRGTSLQVIIYQLKKDSKGNNIELKHVFKQAKRGVFLLSSSDNDELNQPWDNYWDTDGQPILNESDLSEPVIDGSGFLPIGGATKVAAGIKIAGSASKSWSVYTFITTTGRYYGMTTNYLQRMAQHGLRIVTPPIEMIQNIPDKLTARGIEQLFINFGVKNKIITKQINSINPKRVERYNQAIKQAKEFLLKNYPGEYLEIL